MVMMTLINFGYVFVKTKCESLKITYFVKAQYFALTKKRNHSPINVYQFKEHVCKTKNIIAYTIFGYQTTLKQMIPLQKE